MTIDNVQRFRPSGAGWRQIAAATPASSNGTRNVAAMIHRHATPRIQPVGTKRNHPPTMSFRASETSRGIFPSCMFYLVLVYFPTWWISPLRYRSGRNDILEGDSVLSAQVILGTWRAARLPPLRLRWWAVPFNRTGCIRNVAGGRFAAPTGVVPFNHMS